MDADFFNALYDRIIHVDPDILREIKLHGSRYSKFVNNKQKTM